MNLDRFVGNNPINGLDPSGLAPLPKDPLIQSHSNIAGLYYARIRQKARKESLEFLSDIYDEVFIFPPVHPSARVVETIANAFVGGSVQFDYLLPARIEAGLQFTQTETKLIDAILQHEELVKKRAEELIRDQNLTGDAADVFREDFLKTHLYTKLLAKIIPNP